MGLKYKDITISVSRWTSNEEPQEGYLLMIETKDDSKIQVRAEMTPEQFAAAITGKTATVTGALVA